MKFALNVNGERRAVDVDERTPLLWALRDELDLKGTKFGCGMSLCGACTVHVDGTPIRACVTPVSAVGEGAITTIEIDAAMAGNLCRCATYTRIRAAIKRAAGITSAATREA